jgi:4-hydroxy-3-methylbut-2-enyl diphosphate reductase
VELLRVTDEDEYFPPPRNIRELQAAIGTAAAAMVGGPPEVSNSFDDRGLAASDVLATLRTS